MPPVEDHPTHPMTQHGADSRYGCHNKPRPKKSGFVVGASCYGSQKWKFKNSTECKHDMRATDAWCMGCTWINGEGNGPRD